MTLPLPSTVRNDTKASGQPSGVMPLSRPRAIRTKLQSTCSAEWAATASRSRLQTLPPGPRPRTLGPCTPHRAAWNLAFETRTWPAAPSRRGRLLPDVRDLFDHLVGTGKQRRRNGRGGTVLRQKWSRRQLGAMNYPIFSIRFALFASIAALVLGGTAIASMERNVSEMNIRPS